MKITENKQKYYYVVSYNEFGTFQTYNLYLSKKEAESKLEESELSLYHLSHIIFETYRKLDKNRNEDLLLNRLLTGVDN